MTYQQQRYFRLRLKEDVGILRYLHRRLHLDSEEQHALWKLRRNQAAIRIAKVARDLSLDEILTVQLIVRRVIGRMGLA